jgi:PmbA protein
MSFTTFDYSQNDLADLANNVLGIAHELGATSAQVEISEGKARGVDVLNGAIENFETSYEQGIAVTIYVGNQRGIVGSSGIIKDVASLVKQAVEIAKASESDPYNKIADKEYLCTTINDKDLQLHNPVEITNDELIMRAKHIEQLGLTGSKQITQSDGSSLSMVNNNFRLANSNGFNLGYQTTRYSSSLSLIGNTNNGMQTDSWYSVSRDYSQLSTDSQLANKTIERVTRRLNQGKAQSGNFPVIFEADIAKSIIGNFLSAISGNNQFRKLSFLTGAKDTQVLPSWLNIYEDPFVIKGLSSCYFDNEGVKVAATNLVKHGIIDHYLLSSYTAYKLGLTPTGNAGGAHNIFVNHNTKGGITELSKIIGEGLIVIETIGHGLNMVSGDYSVGASGLWVKNGEIQHFVDNLTISGNLKYMLANIAYISDDTDGKVAINCGSMVVDGVTITA